MLWSVQVGSWRTSLAEDSPGVHGKRNGALCRGSAPNGEPLPLLVHLDPPASRAAGQRRKGADLDRGHGVSHVAQLVINGAQVGRR